MREIFSFPKIKAFHKVEVHMKYFLLFFFPLVPVISGCGFSGLTFSIEDKHDDFNNYSTSVMVNNYVHGMVNQLNMGNYIDSQNDTTYSIAEDYQGVEWMFIPKGESMIMLIDGRRFAFSGLGSEMSRQVVGGIVEEVAIYLTSYDTLYTIAHATSVRVQIQGEKGTKEFALSPDNFVHFQQFLVHIRRQ